MAIISRKLFRLFAFAAIYLFFGFNLQAGGIYTGSVMKSKQLQFSSGGGITLNQSQFIASEEIELTGEGPLDGDRESLIQAPKITIIVSKFNFRGTIDCSGACTIIVKEKFNRTMFKRKGGGTFTITVDPDHEIFNTYLENPKIVELKELELKLTIPQIVNSKLAEAIENGDLDEFRKIVVNNPQIKDDKRSLMQLLIIAGEYRRMEFARELISLGATFENLSTSAQKDFFDLDLLYIAIDVDNMVFLRALLETGFDPNGRMPEYSDPFKIEEPLSWREAMGRENRKETRPDSKLKNTPLIFAIEKNNFKAIEILLSSEGIEVDLAISNAKGAITALMLAAYLGHKDIVEELLEAGAERNKKDINGIIALDYARNQNQSEIIKLLSPTKSKPKQTPKEEVIKDTFEEKSPEEAISSEIKQEDTHEVLPEEIILEELGLTISVPHNPVYLEMVETVKNNDFEKFKKIMTDIPETITAKDLMALLLAAGAYKRKDLVEEFIRLGASFEKLNWNNKQKFAGFKLLHRAIDTNNMVFLKGLLDAEFNPNETAETPEGVKSTPLIFATHKNNLEAVELLLSSGKIDVDLATPYDQGFQTALMHAAHLGHKDIVEVFLKAGASKTKLDRYKASALDHAKDQNQSEVVELLEDSFFIKAWEFVKENPQVVIWGASLATVGAVCWWHSRKEL